MKYFVTVNYTVRVYSGISHNRALDSLHMITNVLRSTRATGTIQYYNADASGWYDVIEGEIQQ